MEVKENVMVGLINKSLAAALLCGALGLAGSALAQDNSAESAPAGANATAAAHTGPGQIDSTAAAKANTSSYGASGSASASLQTDKPEFLASVQSKSTPARGLKGAAMKRVDTNERHITADLNKASAASTGNANASSQASISSGSNPNIQ
jgi:hypothetical protein